MKRKRQAKLVGKQLAGGKEEAETPKALLNDVVLQNIFKYLGYKDLKIIRNVKNTIWLRNSKTAWWSRTKVELTKEKVEEYLNQTELHSCVKNYTLGYFRGGDYNGVWEHCGNSIKYLELSVCKFNSVDEFRRIIYTGCPNLEKLVANILQIKTNTVAVEPMKWEEPRFGEQKNLKFLKIQFNSCIMPLTWMELLSHFPNLEALEARTEVDVYKVISIIRQHDPKKLKLKHIDIRGLSEIDCDESFRRVLLDPNLSFETIWIGNEICEPVVLIDILNLHVKSLKELCLFGVIPGSPFQISPSQPLLKLEKLNLTGCLFAADIFKYTPNLRNIHLNYKGGHTLLKNVDSEWRINACKELTIGIYGRCGDLPTSDLAFFLTACPNVETLRISGLNNEKFAMICEHWTNLVSFEVPSRSRVDDFGLLGFDPDSKTETVRNPNITNLKGLETFSMWSCLFRVEQETEVIVVGGEMKNAAVVSTELEKLPRLKKFEIRNYELKEEQEWKEIFAKYSGD